MLVSHWRRNQRSPALASPLFFERVPRNWDSLFLYMPLIPLINSGPLVLAYLQKLGEFSLSLVIVFTAVSNLNRSLVFSSCLSFMFFHRVKEPKRPPPAKSVITAFCSRVARQHPSIGCYLPPNPFILFLGGAELLQLATRRASV